MRQFKWWMVPLAPLFMVFVVLFMLLFALFAIFVQLPTAVFCACLNIKEPDFLYWNPVTTSI
jgi:hypothetical protein